ncbi:MAG: cytochrome P450 [Geodermatophilaceae bacterium]
MDKADLFERKFGAGPLLEHHTTSMLFQNPPNHERLRSVVIPFFSPKSLERLREFINNKVDRLLDEIQERGELDFVIDFAAKIPIALITHILGVPDEDGPMLRGLGLRVLYPLNPRVADEAIKSGHEAAAEFAEYMHEHIVRARARGLSGDPETIVEALVAAEQGSGAISEAEIVHNCLLVLNGGHTTTTDLLGVGTHTLLGLPDDYRALAEMPERSVAGAIEELLRFVSPLQLQSRRTTRKVDLPSGQSVPADTEVWVCPASANRDDRVVDNPETLDLARKPNAHVAFGLGVHVCLGRPLARMETVSAFPKLARRFPELHRAGPPVFNQNARFRGLASLPVRVS